MLKTTAADEPAGGACPRIIELGIIELEAVSQQLQRRREVVSRHVDNAGVQRVSVDGQTERRHMNPQLVRAAGAWREPVEAVADRLDQRLGVGFARLGDRL